MTGMKKPYNKDMLRFIHKYGPVSFDELCAEFGNGIGRIVEMEIANLLDNTFITKRIDGKYVATNNITDD